MENTTYTRAELEKDLREFKVFCQLNDIQALLKLSDYTWGVFMIRPSYQTSTQFLTNKQIIVPNPNELVLSVVLTLEQVKYHEKKYHPEYKATPNSVFSMKKISGLGLEAGEEQKENLATMSITLSVKTDPQTEAVTLEMKAGSKVKKFAEFYELYKYLTEERGFYPLDEDVLEAASYSVDQNKLKEEIQFRSLKYDKALGVISAFSEQQPETTMKRRMA